MTVFLSGWHPTEFSQIRLCLIAADKLQEPLIPRWRQEGLAEIIGVQQEGQNFEDLPLTKETTVTASHSISSLVFLPFLQPWRACPGHTALPVDCTVLFNQNWLWNVFSSVEWGFFLLPSPSHVSCLVTLEHC